MDWQALVGHVEELMATERLMLKVSTGRRPGNLRTGACGEAVKITGVRVHKYWVHWRN